MKCFLALTASPLLLLLVLLDSTSSLPFVIDPEDGEIFLSVDPKLQLIPVVFEVDPYSSVEVEEDFTGERSIEEEVLSRKRRQTSVSGGVNTENLGQGVNRNSGHLNLEHTSDPHTFLGGLNLDHTRVPGLGTNTNVGVQGGYQYKPSPNTALSAVVSHSRGVGGFGQGLTNNAGNLGITHTSGKHSLTGSLGADRTNIPGFGGVSNVNAGVGYEYKIDKDHSINLDATHSRGDSGRSNSAFLSFRKKFNFGKK